MYGNSIKLVGSVRGNYSKNLLMGYSRLVKAPIGFIGQRTRVKIIKGLASVATREDSQGFNSPSFLNPH
jgi:hypothetical protein